jgi:hypothetical protein
MSNIIFMYNNLVDVASVYPTTENDSFPATNVQHPFRTKAWRSGSGIGDLLIDFGSAKTFTCAALCNYDWATAPNSLDLQFCSNSSFNASSYTVETQVLSWAANPSTSGNQSSIVTTFTLTGSYQFAKLRVNANSIFNIGRVFLGEYYQPDANYLYGYNQSLVDPSKSLSTITGQDHIDELEGYRVLKITLPARTQAEWQLFQKMWNTAAKKKEIFVAFDLATLPQEMTIYGRLNRDMGMSRREGWFDISLDFKESPNG